MAKNQITSTGGLSAEQVQDMKEGLRALKAPQAEREAIIKELDGKAEAMIWSNILVNAGMGAIPLGINIWAFVAANTATIVGLGHLYGFTMSKEQAGALIKQMISAVGLTWAATFLGLKFFAEVLKGAGVFTMGGATVGGMALDAVLGGTISYAIGYTAKSYFKNGCKLTAGQMGAEFKARYAEGKTKVQQAIKDKAAGKTTS